MEDNILNMHPTEDLHTENRKNSILEWNKKTKTPKPVISNVLNIYFTKKTFLWDPHGLQPTRLLCSRNSPGKNTGVGLPFPSPGELRDPGIELGPPALQVDSLPSELPGRPQRRHMND